MTTRLITVTTMVLLIVAPSVRSQASFDACRITYVANEGFLIETKHHRVLVDALFGNIEGDWCDQPTDSVANLMLEGIAPFDKIDVVLVTHKHIDHFNGPMVVKFLMNNRKSVLICPDQVNELLQRNADYSEVSERVHSLKSAIPFDTTLRVKNADIRVLRFNHGSYFETDSVTGKAYDRHRGVENFGYLIMADGYTLFHSGDGSPSDKTLYVTYGFGKKELDVVFLDRLFLQRDGQELMSEYLKTRNLILMHIQRQSREYYKSAVRSVPAMFVFTSFLETKVITK